METIPQVLLNYADIKALEKDSSAAVKEGKRAGMPMLPGSNDSKKLVIENGVLSTMTVKPVSSLQLEILIMICGFLSTRH